ncbi:hypothetical protein HXY33_02815 [Candidatus Bathyarchaeota archaeon]|nr:hypothetical protein [Candidatus Bathyarchaeota archaeon]
MKAREKRLATNRSGQLLIIAALTIAILISSTMIYVYEVSRETNSQDYVPISNFVLAIKQSTRNTMISSLANVSNGGESSVLAANLNEFSQVSQSLSHFGTCHLAFTLLNNSNYDDGIWLSWNTSDIGVSSAYSDFTLRIYSLAENLTLDYDVNITTSITVSGYYTRLVGDEKQVNLTCNMYNEGEPALAENFTLLYENLGSWIPVNSSNSLSVTDYGNGTYSIAFTVSVPSDSVQVSAYVYDLRNVFVRANTTCAEV